MDQKGFGFWTGWSVVVASMVGAGILTNSGPILKATQSYTGLLIVWAVGGLLAVSGAFTLAELASGRPKAGGDYSYVKEAFGPAVGFTYGWAMVLVGFAAPISLIAYTTANYLYPNIQPWLGDSVSSRNFNLLFASCMVVLFTISHCLGHKSSSRVQITTTFFNFALLVSLPFLGFFDDNALWNNFSLSAPLSSVPVTSWGSHLILVLYAYTGWNAAAYLSGEMKNPTKTLPLALILGCLAVTALYVVVNVVYCVALPPEKLATLTSSEWQRLAEVSVRALWGTDVSQVFSLLVSMGTVASLSAYTLTGPRIVYAMAHDGLFPSFAGKLNAKTHVPVAAILIQGTLALAFLWSGTFEQVLQFAGYGLAVVGMLAVSPIFWLRKKADFTPRFRVPLYPFTPLLFLFVSFCSLAMGFWEQPGLSSLSIAGILVGFPLYAVIRWKSKNSFGQAKALA